MEKNYVIQDAKTGKYWYGWYSSKTWTKDITEAKLLGTKENVEFWIKANIETISGMFLVLVEVYVNK